MQRRKLKIKVYAKVNLSLNILGLRGNLHELDMVLTSVDIADVITVCERFDSAVNVEFSGAGIPSDNSVTKAFSEIAAVAGAFGADVYVEKNIPLSGGLGGSSADAAGVLFALDKIYDLTLRGADTAKAAFKTGSDVLYMTQGGFKRVGGAGERVESIASRAELFLCICKDKNGVSAKSAYTEFDRLYPPKKYCPSNNDLLISSLIKGDTLAASKEFGNALYNASVSAEPQIRTTLEALERTGALKCFMSGSGSACVGMYEDFNKAEAAARSLTLKGYYAKAVTNKLSGVEII